MWSRGWWYLSDLPSERVDAARVSVLQDVELGARQVEGGPPSAIQGVHTCAWERGGERQERERERERNRDTEGERGRE